MTTDRIKYLLSRAGALGLAMERWQRAGLWVLTRSDADYPSRLKRHLGNDSPPVLFGCGNRRLLNQGGVAVVGSRAASEDDLAFSAGLGRGAASQGLSIVSGGARGVDEAAMLGALEREGTVVGVLADGLLRAATSAKYRKGLIANNLALVSPFYPEAGFDVGNAMVRNRYIYCLSDAAIVVVSSKDKGGTWNGAIENLNQGWVPLWVKPHPDAHSGNAELVRRGARWLPEGELQLSSLFAAHVTTPNRKTPDTLGRTLELPDGRPLLGEMASRPADVGRGSAEPKHEKQAPTDVEKPGTLREETLGGSSFYDLFLLRLETLTKRTPATADELLDRLDLTKAQLDCWLKRAIGERRVRKLRKPVRYQSQAPQPKQGTIFGNG